MTDLNEMVDRLYQGEVISTESMRTIGTALRLERQGHSAEQISIELGLPSEQVKQLVIRAKGWELSQQSEQKYSRYRR